VEMPCQWNVCVIKDQAAAAAGCEVKTNSKSVESEPKLMTEWMKVLQDNLDHLELIETKKIPTKFLCKKYISSNARISLGIEYFF